MDPFELPAELPVTVAELSQLREAATAEITRIQQAFETNADLSDDDVTYLESLNDAVDTLDAALAEATSSEEAHRSAVNAAIARGRAATAAAETGEGDDADEDEADDADEDEGDDEDEDDDRQEMAAASAKKPAKRKHSFRRVGEQEAPGDRVGPSWVVAPGAPGFKAADIGKRVSFDQMGEALDSVLQGKGRGRLTGSPHPTKVGKLAQTLVHLSRGYENMPVIDDPHALVAAINAATDERKLPGGSLVAAGGWTSPSELIYTFCDVPNASDLLVLPNIPISRGGLKWPIEPDLTSILESFQFFFPEPELEDVDDDGNPTAVKHQVEIPAPTDFEEIRLSAVGYSVKAGILQRQGWPESISYFLQVLAQEHLRAMSRRKVLTMVHASTLVSPSSSTMMGTTSAILNSLELQAVNQRLHRGLPRNATIEGVAPSWLPAAVRADLSYRQGLDVFNTSDAQVDAWLRARNIMLQYVGDWQTRDTDLPGKLDTLRWPGHVDVMLYPAGTWFQSQANIIELGVQYPMDQVQVNRYTEFFTEDSYAVGKRCGVTEVVRVPIKVDGAIGARVSLTLSDTSTDQGGFPDYGPPGGGTDGQKDLPVTKVLTVSGTPTGGTFKLTLDADETDAIAYNATPAAVKAALVGLNDAYGENDFTVTGDGNLPGNPLTIVFPGGALSVTSKAFTGGTTPDAALSDPS